MRSSGICVKRRMSTTVADHGTNDNVDALRFYQRRGFHVVKLHAGTVDRSRESLKPEIPEESASTASPSGTSSSCRSLFSPNPCCGAPGLTYRLSMLSFIDSIDER